MKQGNHFRNKNQSVPLTVNSSNFKFQTQPRAPHKAIIVAHEMLDDLKDESDILGSKIEYESK